MNLPVVWFPHSRSEVIRGHQRSSEVIRGHQRSSEATRWQSEDNQVACDVVPAQPERDPRVAVLAIDLLAWLGRDRRVPAGESAQPARHGARHGSQHVKEGTGRGHTHYSRKWRRWRCWDARRMRSHVLPATVISAPAIASGSARFCAMYATSAPSALKPREHAHISPDG